jgi:hypothetical protein
MLLAAIRKSKAVSAILIWRTRDEYRVKAKAMAWDFHAALIRSRTPIALKNTGLPRNGKRLCLWVRNRSIRCRSLEAARGALTAALVDPSLALPLRSAVAASTSFLAKLPALLTGTQDEAFPV